jgi:capsular polysaccharide transport system ATP-binding protein
MIELINVTKYYPTEFGRHYVFRNVNLRLPLDKSVGVVGPNGAGKSTFLGLIAGADTPNEGRVVRSGRISPPMGLTPGLLTTLTGSENTRFACRIHGMSRKEMDETVASASRCRCGPIPRACASGWASRSR